MRLHPISIVVAAVLALASASALAQQSAFEGSVSFDVEHGGTMLYSAGQGLVRIDLDAASHRVATIFDPAKKTMLVIMFEQKMYMQREMPKLDVENDSAGELTNTGKSDVVAGVKCEIWHAESTRGTFDVCAARDMGGFLPNISFSHEPPAWAKVLRGGFFPLRVTNAKGETTLLATKVERRRLDASFFAIPAGFTKLDLPAGIKLPSPGAAPRGGG